MSWGIKQYKIKLKHQLKMNKLKRQYDFRAQISRDVLLDEYLVNTRRNKASVEQESVDLEQELQKNNQYDC